MSNFYGMNFNNYNTSYLNSNNSNLFLGGTKTNSSSDLSSLFGDYASIQNGSYKKLLKAYYAKNTAESAADAGNDTKKSLDAMKDQAVSLEKSAKALSDPVLFEKKLIKVKDDKTGTEVEKLDYDRENIKKAVNDFVENYNSTLDMVGKSDIKSVLRSGVWMTNAVKANKNLLGEAGISITKENKLKVDEDVLNKADISTLKILFQENNSFADKMQQKGSQIGKDAGKAAASIPKIYSNKAEVTTENYTGTYYNSIF